MKRTFDPDHILAALIEAFQEDQHFILHQDGKIFARLVATEDETGPIPFNGKVDICLTSLANAIARRLSQ